MHPSRELATLGLVDDYPEPGRSSVVILAHATRRDGDLTDYGSIQDDRWTWHLRCPTCSRHLELNEANMLSKMQALHRAQHDRPIDVSLLPS